MRNREFTLIRVLHKLFQDIDINGNGDVDWDEFTNFIIEKAEMNANGQNSADYIKKYSKSKIVAVY